MVSNKRARNARFDFRRCICRSLPPRLAAILKLKHFPFRPSGKGAKRESQRSGGGMVSRGSRPLAAGFGAGCKGPNMETKPGKTVSSPAGRNRKPNSTLLGEFVLFGLQIASVSEAAHDFSKTRVGTVHAIHRNPSVF